jgi:Lysozyme like domain
VKWFALAFCVVMFGPLLFLLPLLGLFLQPWAPWWFGKQSNDVAVTVPIDSAGGGASVPFNPSTQVVTLPALSDAAPIAAAPIAGHVSDVQRYQLITAAGAAQAVAIIMTALSIAEDGGGDPSIVSPPNWNKTVDIGLWQVNSSHIGACGIVSQAWLFDPTNNARAAMCILGAQLNYCAWSTYERACGVGYTGAYAAFLPCARAIAEGNTCRR